MDCDGNRLEKETCLPFLTKPSYYQSFAPSTESSHLELDLQMVWSVMELDCMIDVARYTLTVLYLRRVANFFADWCYKMEDTLDLCSS